MFWYQIVGIAVAAIVAVLGVPKLFRETLGPYRLSARVVRASEVAEKVNSEGAKRDLTAYAETLANRLAALHVIKFSRRDKSVIAGCTGVSVVIWLTFLMGWPVSIPELIDNRALKFVVRAVALIVAQWGLIAWLPRLQTIQYRRSLYAELAAPQGLRELAIPSLRDYFWRPTLTPKLILSTARGNVPDPAQTESGTERSGMESETANATSVPNIASVNASIAQWEQIYRHAPARP